MCASRGTAKPTLALNVNTEHVISVTATFDRFLKPVLMTVICKIMEDTTLSEAYDPPLPSNLLSLYFSKQTIKTP